MTAERPSLAARAGQVALNRVLPIVLRIVREWRGVVKLPLSSWVLVTRFDDVQEVMTRSDVFHVPYQPKVDAIGWTPTFLLAMRDGPAYREVLAHVHALWRQQDLPLLRDHVAARTRLALGEAAVRLDLPEVVFRPLAIALIEDYYGVAIPPERRDACIDSCLTIAGYLFGPPEPSAKSLKEAREAMPVLWQAIDAALGSTPRPDTVLARGLGPDRPPGLTDDGLRSCLMGMIVGSIPTFLNASGRIAETLLRQPQIRELAVERARQAAPDVTDERLLAMLHEALRLDYILPGVWRTNDAPVTLDESGRRPRSVPAKANVYVCLGTAMRDPRRFQAPADFDPARAPESYLLYGYRLHWCVGGHIADTMLTEMYRQLLARAVRLDGRPIWNGMFVRHLAACLEAAA